MKTNTIITLFFMLFALTKVDAQQLFVEAGKTLTSFDYQNAYGGSLANLQSSSKSIMALGLRSEISGRLKGNYALSYAGYGALGSDEATGTFMKWDLNYGEIIAGIDFDVIDFGRGSIYLKGATGLSFLIQGTQIINNQVFTLRNTDDFKMPMVSGKLGFGGSYLVGEYLSVYAHYLYSKSMKMKSRTFFETGTEELSMVSNQITFGFLFDLNTNGLNRRPRRP